jgi:hypothetical protein
MIADWSRRWTQKRAESFPALKRGLGAVGEPTARVLKDAYRFMSLGTRPAGAERGFQAGEMRR